ncbi:MAG: 3-deoxy-7-phosphoheptulonate synthase class [Rickettsiaceae bacterium]|jgi:3-deoxy-7-phosphoheptulonate synthase|nr:3-deoxy-7-phosphoheptulonate synthase class [Rickettsiaceae bacterium]
MSKNWSTNSWRNLPIKQQPIYEDKAELQKVENELSKFPVLVSFNEVDDLRADLAKVAKGEAFLLQAGDCAESFAEFNHTNIKNYFRTILQMTIALMYGLKKPVVKVGRVAGQYAKPRSDDFETIDGVSLPSYRGDIVNGIEFNKDARKCDPQRLIKAYFHSAATLNYIRSLAIGGYASLRNVNSWNEKFVSRLNKEGNNIEEIIGSINQTISFIESCGLNSSEFYQLNSAKFYTSHEALLLNYEQQFTRVRHMSDESKKYYDLSAHLLWIGDRTRGVGEAHVEFMRGIENPIAFKVGPSISEDDLIKLIDVLNPTNDAGRITLISRMGAKKVEDLLPKLVERVKSEGKNVIWSCDPMHGNTMKSANNYKTRKFDDILSEIKSFLTIHRSIGTYAGGIHFEMTGQDVTECLGGNQAISEMDLQDRYHTHCDPRLNSSQSLELAFLIAEELQGEINGK